jgi:ribosome-binding factor A
MVSKSLRNIKHAQRESHFKRELAQLLQQIAADDAQLRDMFITRVALSANGGSLAIYLTLLEPNEEKLTVKLRHLVLYKPSLRSSLAKNHHSHHIPELVFKIDEQVKKQQRIDQIFDELKNKGEL